MLRRFIDSFNILAYSNEVNDGYGVIPSQLSTLEYGNSDLYLRNRLAVTANYALPFGNNLKGFKAALGKGWQANTLLVWNSGIPFTVLESNGVTSTNQAAQTNVRPNQLRKANLSGFNINQFFDTTAFAPQASGTIGTERRNPLYGPHFRHVDLSVFKSFPVSRESSIEFRAEAFNIINTTNFETPNNTLNAQQSATDVDAYTFQSSTAGQIQSTWPTTLRVKFSSPSNTSSNLTATHKGLTSDRQAFTPLRSYDGRRRCRTFIATPGRFEPKLRCRLNGTVVTRQSKLSQLRDQLFLRFEAAVVLASCFDRPADVLTAADCFEALRSCKA